MSMKFERLQEQGSSMGISRWLTRMGSSLWEEEATTTTLLLSILKSLLPSRRPCVLSEAMNRMDITGMVIS